MKTLTIRLPAPANDMVQEEILKQIAHVSRAVGAHRFLDDGQTIEVSVDDAAPDSANLESDITSVAEKIQRSLRKLDRKVLHRTASGWDRPTTLPDDAGIWFSGAGQVQLSGAALTVLRGLSRLLDGYIEQWHPQPLQTPTLIPATVLSRCDYFRSFPQYVGFVSHLHEEFATIDSFRKRHAARDTIDDLARNDLDLPDTCLSPAVCYHIYHRYSNQALAAPGVTYDVQGRCFRYESTNISDLRRLWEFTMRELVFVGERDWVLSQREDAIARFIPVWTSSICRRKFAPPAIRSSSHLTPLQRRTSSSAAKPSTKSRWPSRPMNAWRSVRSITIATFSARRSRRPRRAVTLPIRCAWRSGSSGWRMPCSCTMALIRDSGQPCCNDRREHIAGRHHRGR